MKGKKIDVDRIDLEKERIKVTDLPGLIEYAHHNGSALVKPEDKGKIKGRAMAAMREQTQQQINQLYRQMQLLATQANELKQRVEVSERIYQSQMNFEPLIGNTYFLYERKDGKDVLSMIGPREWGRSFPFENYLATVKLLSDHTWEIIDYNPERET